VFESPSIAAECPACRQRFSPRPLEVLLKLDRHLKQSLPDEKMADGERLDELLGSSRNGAVAITAILEDIRSLWNVGSIFRSADGAGLDSLLLVGITGTPPRKQIEKTSLGAEAVIPWLYARSILDLVPRLKARNFFVLGLEYTQGLAGIADSHLLSEMLSQNRVPKPVCLIVGNEVTGLSTEAMLSCDLICHLPMRGSKESLNVAVAFGIAAYAVAQRLLP
jgi:tRNA G18 (ribose-2'-O)-methylase SpoU